MEFHFDEGRYFSSQSSVVYAKRTGQPFTTTQCALFYRLSLPTQLMHDYPDVLTKNPRRLP
jgi:hypothetical protein